MTTSTTRRTLLGTIATVTVLAGCTGDIVDDDSNSDTGSDESEDSDLEETDSAEEPEDADELTQTEIVDRVESMLEDEGIQVESIDRIDDDLELAYEATGSTDEAIMTEIDTVGDVYVRAINTGLMTDRLDALVQEPETGSTLDSFRIETEWVRAYSNDEIEWEEYVDRIAETFESS